MASDEDEKMDISAVGKSPKEMTQQASVAVTSSHNRNVPVDVYPWFEITVQNIDVTSQKWRASVEIHLFWQDFGVPAQNPYFEETDIKIEEEEDLPVKMSEVFENKLWEDVQHVQYKYLPETSTIYMLMIVQVEFVERMELHRFPMDRQFLGMDFNAWTGPDPNGERLNWNWITSPPEWVPEAFSKPFAVRMLSTITEYELMSPWVDFSKEQPLSIRLRVERQPGYYGSSIILPNFLIIAVAISGFTIPIDSEEAVADRLSVSVTLMLTAVAFKYVITEQLPKITYMTLMDYYLNLGFLMLTFLVGENAMTGVDAVGSIQFRNDLDNYIMYGFIGVWTVVHIWWLAVCVSEHFMRVSWERMNVLDQIEEDEFVYAPEEKSIANPQSIENISEYKMMRGKSVADRKSVYQEQHPDIATPPPKIEEEDK